MRRAITFIVGLGSVTFAGHASAQSAAQPESGALVAQANPPGSTYGVAPGAPGAPAPAPAAGTADRWWDNPPLEERDDTTPRTLKVVGGAMAGLGGLALLGGSITWLVAAGESLAVDEESCPNKICYANSRGGEALQRARDAETGAGIVVGIGVPVLTAGLVMLLYGAGLSGGKGRRDLDAVVLPTVGPSSAGLSMEVTF